MTHDIDKTLGIAGNVTPTHGKSRTASASGKRRKHLPVTPISMRRRDKSPGKEEHNRASTIQKRCSKYKTFDSLENVLHMDIKAVISPRTIEKKRKEKKQLDTYYKPLVMRMPSLYSKLESASKAKEDYEESFLEVGSADASDMVLERLNSKHRTCQMPSSPQGGGTDLGRSFTSGSDYEIDMVFPTFSEGPK